MRILKNLSREWVNKNVNGRIYTIKPKGSLTITDQQADIIAQDLLTTYGFLKDITPKQAYEAPKTDAQIKKKVKPAQAKVVKKGKKVRRP